MQSWSHTLDRNQGPIIGQNSKLEMNHLPEWGEALKFLGQIFSFCVIKDITPLSLINRWLYFLCRHPFLSIYWLKNYQLLTKVKHLLPLYPPPPFFLCLDFYWIIIEHFHSAYLCLVGFFLGPCLVVMKI